MKNIFKKFGTAFTTVALALCLTACNNNGASSGGISAPLSIQSSSNTSNSTMSSSSSSMVTSSSSKESYVSESSSESSVKSTESVSETSVPTEVSEQSSNELVFSEPPEPSEPVSEPTDEEKTLVVYFTWSSNTAGIAETIADLTGADTFEIVPVNPYPEEYTPCTKVALEERDNNARPEIQNLPASVSEYDNILIGYPIWWHTAPMIIGTFLENYNLTGIDVYPFTQSASMNTEQFEQSMDFVRGCAANATVHDGLFARSSDTSSIRSYLEQNGLTK